MIAVWPGGDLSDAVGGDETRDQKSSKLMAHLVGFSGGPKFTASRLPCCVSSIPRWEFAGDCKPMEKRTTPVYAERRGYLADLCDLVTKTRAIRRLGSSTRPIPFV